MDKELKLLVITQDLWDQFVEAGFTHPDEANEVRHKIHGIQSIIATRIMRKLAPDIFPTYIQDMVNGIPRPHKFSPEEQLEAIKSILPEDLKEKICK